MNKVLVLYVVSVFASMAMAAPEVDRLVFECKPTLPSNYFSHESINLFVDRSQLPRIKAHFIKQSDRYSDYFDPFSEVGDLVGNEYFEIINLSGVVSDQYGLKNSSRLIKFKILNGRLKYMDSLGRFVVPNSKDYDEREWSCSENEKINIEEPILR